MKRQYLIMRGVFNIVFGPLSDPLNGATANNVTFTNQSARYMMEYFTIMYLLSILSLLSLCSSLRPDHVYPKCSRYFQAITDQYAMYAKKQHRPMLHVSFSN
jgi:hypothetical protein